MWCRLVIVPDVTTLERAAAELPVVVHGHSHERVDVIAHALLIGADGARERDFAARGGRQLVEQVRGVAQREVRAQAEGGEHGVGGVADQGHPARLPGRRGLEEPERDHEDRVQVDAPDQGPRGGVPALDCFEHGVAEHGRSVLGPLR
jgi:hypothetical protein